MRRAGIIGGLVLLGVAFYLAGARACSPAADVGLARSKPPAVPAQEAPASPTILSSPIDSPSEDLAPSYVESLNLLTVNRLTRSVSAILTPDNPAFSRDLDVTPDGYLVDVSVFCHPESAEEGFALCKVAFETEGAEPRVLLEETVTAGQTQWQTRQIDLAEHNGQTGRLTVAAESTHERPFRVFLSVSSPYKRRSAGDTNLILICLDTLRADHMSCYGHWRSTSPFMDSLADKGVRFARCNSQAPWTGPSLFSVFTGQYAACGWDGYLVPGGIKWQHNRDALTIARHLSAHGFSTMAVTGGGVTRPGYGLANGFSAYEVAPYSQMPEVYDRAVDWLEAHGRDKFFLFFHTYEIHEPYLRRIFSDGPKDMKSEAIRNYDSGILFADGYLEKLFGKLEEWGLLANTLVVIFSDHGEDFDEVDSHGPGGPHGHHGWLLRESSLHVPLILVGPGIPKGIVVEELVALMDLGPTILELLGVEPLPEMDAVSLAAMIRGDKAEAPETALYSEGLRRGLERKALREGRWRVVYKPSPDEIAHSALPGRPFDRHWEEQFDKLQLHDLTEDPGQNVNLFDRRPEIAEPMLARLKEIMRRNEETASRNETAFERRFVRWHGGDQADRDDQADEQLLRQLKALGYVD